MVNALREKLHGWGYCPVVECDTFRPEKTRALHALLESHEGPLLARGLGRSYGDASLQPHGTIRTERLDHFIDLDSATGIVRAQAGATLSDLMNISIPQGWLPPVIPGTRHVTLGGAFASNIHGKNQFRLGEFAEHVQSIRLLLASGDSVECSPNYYSGLFWATAGGMGMTGVIEEVTLQLKKIESASLKALRHRTDSIEEMLANFEHYREHADYMVGWIDHMATGKALGRGVFEAAYHFTTEEGAKPLKSYRAPKASLNVPFFMPSFLLNKHSMAIYNRLHFARHTQPMETVGLDDFFHPLDKIGHWYRLYGKRGFFQYQCLIPETGETPKQLRELLEGIQRGGLFSFLAVIKYHREGKGLLTFSKKGYSLALDFPNTSRVRALLPQLDRFVAERGGRTYLAKDALLTHDLFDKMYGQSGADWRRLIADIDPDSRFKSLMSERLQWKAKH